jgi:glycosyltransferase involved in cell wall biosynthesis
MRSGIPLTPRDLYLGCFADVRGWGGALASAAAVAAAGERRGVSTLLLGASTRAAAAPAILPNTPRFNVRVAPEPLLWRVQSWRASRQLAAWLRRLPSPRAGFVGLSPYWVIAARRAWPGLPVFYRLPCVLHNCLPFTWPQRHPPTLWARLNFAGITRAEHMACAAADVIFAPTELARQEVLTFHPAARGRVHICPEGHQRRDISAQVRLAQRCVLNVSEDAVVFLLVGRCDLNKAFDWAIRELPAVDPRGRLVIVGDGPERARLGALAQELGVADRVHFVGPHQDMEPWYAAADCVVSTSFYDTFPNALQEALCRGRPVVVPDHQPPHVYAGFAGVVSHEGGGLLYDRTRAGALAACLNSLARDRSVLRRLSRQARLASGQWFRRGSIVDRILTWRRADS